MKFKYILPALLLLFCQAAFAQQQKKDTIDTELEQCLAKKENETTIGMCECTYKALEQWDKKLNTVYKSLHTKLRGDAKTKLTEAQREWVKFKQKEIELVDATYGSAEGTLWRIVRAQEVLEITRQRAVDLEGLLEMLDEM